MSSYEYGAWRKHLYSRLVLPHRRGFRSGQKADGEVEQQTLELLCTHDVCINYGRIHDNTKALAAFYRVLKHSKNMQNYSRSFVLEKELPVFMSWDLSPHPHPPRQVILHQLCIFMPFLPGRRHQVRQPRLPLTSAKSSPLPEIYTRIRTDPLNPIAPNLKFGSSVTFLRSSSHPCVLKPNGVAFGTETGTRLAVKVSSVHPLRSGGAVFHGAT